MALYGLPPNPFERGEFNGKAYVPRGLSDAKIEALASFLDQATGEDDVRVMADFIEGRGPSSTADDVGRNTFRTWFQSARIGQKINDKWDQVLSDQECTPQLFIRDSRDNLRAGKKAEFSSTMPSMSGVRTKCEEWLVRAVFGEAGMGKRVANSDVVYCMGGIWHHQWARYLKLRKKALENREDAMQAYLKKRNGSSLFSPVTDVD